MTITDGWPGPRRTVAALSVGVLLLGACGEREEPVPPIGTDASGSGTDDTGTDTTRADDTGTESEDGDVADGVQIGRGEVAHLGDDVRVGVYSLLGATRAQLSLHAGDDSLEVAELQVGDVEELGGYRFELVEVTETTARVAVTGPDGEPISTTGG